MAEQDQPAVLYYDSNAGKVFHVVESEEVDVEGMRAIVAQADALVAANNPQPEQPAAPAQPDPAPQPDPQPAQPDPNQPADPNAAPAAPVAPVVQ